MSNVTILIPVKKESIRCRNKNLFLLPYTLQYLKDEGFGNVTVLSDSLEFEYISKLYGYKHKVIPRIKNDDELKTCWRFLKNKKIDFFALCPVTHPFKAPGLIGKMISKYLKQKSNIEFCTSYICFKKRSPFFVNKKKGNFHFKYNYKIRSGIVLKDNIKMLDGAMYIISKKFIKSVASSKSSNYSFWNGKFSCVENKVPFLDIDSEDDLIKFKNILKNDLKHA